MESSEDEGEDDEEEKMEEESDESQSYRGLLDDEHEEETGYIDQLGYPQSKKARLNGSKDRRSPPSEPEYEHLRPHEVIDLTPISDQISRLMQSLDKERKNNQELRDQNRVLQDENQRLKVFAQYTVTYQAMLQSFQSGQIGQISASLALPPPFHFPGSMIPPNIASNIVASSQSQNFSQSTSNGTPPDTDSVPSPSKRNNADSNSGALLLTAANHGKNTPSPKRE
jgi:hypothetical protein